MLISSVLAERREKNHINLSTNKKKELWSEESKNKHTEPFVIGSYSFTHPKTKRNKKKSSECKA